MALILTGTMLAGISVNAMELERSMIGESVAKETAVDESIKEEAVSEADSPEGTVFESREDETGFNEEISEGTAVSESFLEEIEGEKGFLENAHGESALSLSERMEEGADLIADSDICALMPMSEAASGKCGENAYWEFDGMDTLTISGSGAMENYDLYDVIPWGEYRNDIVEVRITDGITKIGDRAFDECRSLTNIMIPESVTEIGVWAFFGCTNLVNVEIPEGITEIGEWAFESCSSLANIKIPESVTVIGDGAFSECSSLANMEIPQNVTEIGGSVFSGCSSLANIKIPESVTEIGGWAFSRCSNLVNVKIPQSVTKIGEGVFNGCSGLESIKIPDGVTGIENQAFDKCSGLTNLEIPESVTEIGGCAFRGCSSLKSITLPDGVNGIGQYAFSGCSSLESITLPDGVTGIEQYAFSGCSSLENITLPEGVTEIDRDAFSGCSSLTDIQIPEGVTGIGGYAFFGCSSLTNMKIPENITVIADSVFRGCSSLKKITMPNGVTRIEQYAFLGCSSLAGIQIPENVTEIGGSAFLDCKELAKIVFLGNAPFFSSYPAGPFYNDSLIAYYSVSNKTWTEDVLQDYGGNVTWMPYTNLEDVWENDNPEDLLEAAISTITLFPKNGALDEYSQNLTIKLSTSGNLQLNEASNSQLAIDEADGRFKYTIYGNGKVEVYDGKKSKEYETWEESGIHVEITDSSLLVTIPVTVKVCHVSIFLQDFLFINGQKINTRDTNGKEVLPWSFSRTETDVSFSFRNYSEKYISKDLIKKIYKEAGSGKINKIYKQNLGEGGVCYGIALAEASFEYAPLINLERQDFLPTAVSNWNMKDKSVENQMEGLTLDEFLQIGQVAQSLPEIVKEKRNNASHSLWKRKEAFQEIVDSIKALKEGGRNPIVIGMVTNEGSHAVLPVDFEEYEEKTRIVVVDPNAPGLLQRIDFFKDKGQYTGEWHYSEKYHSKNDLKNYITYTCPVAAFSDAYGNAQVWIRTYALEIAKKMGTVLVPDMDDVVKLEHIAYENGVDENSSDTDFYWLLNEMEIPMDIDGLGDISIAGANIEVQYNNLKAGTATISMQEDNFSFATNQSGQKNAEVSYLFYNESDITKVTIRESEQDNSLEVCNKDEKIYFKGLNSAEIKTETGDYDENGDFVPENTVVKTFTDLSEEEEYEVDGSQEIEHIVRVSDDTVIPEGSPDETEKPLQNIQLSETEINLHEGESRILEVFYTPGDTTADTSVVWTSSDEAVAAVDADGKIRAIKAGYAVITALVGEKSALCHVTVTENKQPDETETPVSTETPSQPTEVPVSTDAPRPPIPTSEPVQTSEPEKPGQTEIPVPTEKPEQPQPTEEPASTAAPEQPVPTVAPSLPQSPEPPQSTEEPGSTVAPEQPVPTAEPISTQIPEQPYPTGTPEPQKPLQSIEFEQKNITLQPGETSKLKVIYTPADTTDSRMVAWTSSDEAVASVTTAGTVTAHKSGTTEITAKVGEKTAVCTVTVKTFEQESNADDGNDNGNESSNSNTEEQSAGAQQETGALSSPKTGEKDDWLIYVVLAGSILAGITAISALLRKKQEK